MIGGAPRKDKKFQGQIMDAESAVMDGAFTNPQVQASQLHRSAQRLKMSNAGMASAGTQLGQAQNAFQQGAQGQDKMLAYLQQRAAGQGGPGAAETQLRTQQEQAARGNMAIAQGNRANPFSARRMAAMANDTASVEGDQQARAVALQDQQNSQAMLGQYLSDMRSQQMGMAGVQGQRQVQSMEGARAGAQFFAEREMQGRLANQGGQMSAVDRGLDLSAADLAAQEAAYGRYRKKNQDDTSAYVGGLSTIGSLISDERAKENVKDEGEGIARTMRALSAKSWDYKDPANGEGRHIGIMAQDLEKTEAGRWLVTERNGVKTIDAKKAIGALLASNAELTKRLDKVEGRK